MTTSGTDKRLKSLERAPADRLPPLRLTRRDLAILEAVYEYRALTTTQIEALLFTPTPGLPYSRKKRCQTRLKLLFHHRFLFRDEQPTKLSEGRRPLVYTLDKKGIDLLSEELKLEAREIKKQSNPQLHSTSSPFLRHLLTTNDVRIAITLAAERTGVEIKEWLDDHSLKRDHDKVTISGPKGVSLTVAVIPDGYFWLWTGKHNFHNFLEIDMRTVVGRYRQPGLKDWDRRVRAYKEYYQSGLYQQRFSGATKSMRVCTVTTGETRLANLKEITEKVAGKDVRRFWFTTFQSLNPETALLGKVWQVAGTDRLRALIW